MLVTYSIYLHYTIHQLEYTENFFFERVLICSYKETSFLRISNYLHEVVSIKELLLLHNIIVLKSSQDILQGVSKLDHLIKYSQFQIYKDPDLRK